MSEQLDQTNQNQNPDPSLEYQSPPIPPTHQPPASSIDPDAYKLLQDTLRETNRRNAALEEQLARGPVTAPVAPKARTTEEISSERDAFFSDPIGVLRTNIKELLDVELKATVDPLNAFVREMKGSTAIDRLVNQYKTDNRFSALWDNGVEAYVREQAANVPPQQLDQLFPFIVTSGLGMKSAGLIPNTTPKLVQDPPTPPRREEVIPPTIRTTPITPEPAPRRPNVRQLNELENRMLREYNSKHPDKPLTAEQFIQLQELPANQVATSKIGVPEKK